MIYSIKNFLCKLFIDFFQFSWQISLRKMYLISEELVLAMLSDSGFSVLDSDDDSLSRSYAAAAAAAGYAAIYIVLCLSLAAWAFSKREF